MSRSLLLSTAAVGLVLVWSYWHSLSGLAHRWSNELDYNHCFFVPIFSLFLLYWRWDLRPQGRAVSRRSIAIGVAMILLAGGLRFASAYFRYVLLEPMSLLPCLTGVTLLVGGWPALRWAWPSILFLGFMIPLPGFLAGQLSHPLQRMGTISSTAVLQTLGIPAVSVGNVIRLTDGEIGVVEACSGLRMLNLFFAMTVGASFLVERPLWEKAVIVVSAAFIGLFSNVIRITASGIAHELAGQEFADGFFHDLAGWMMMPLAMLILACGLWLSSKLLIPATTDEPLELVGQGTRSAD